MCNDPTASLKSVLLSIQEGWYQTSPVPVSLVNLLFIWVTLERVLSALQRIYQPVA